MNKIPVLSIDVNSGTPEEFVDEITSIAANKKSEYVCVANVHMLVEAHNDPSFAGVVNNANITTPDGVPLTWAIKKFHKIKQDRVAGMDLLPALLKRASALQLPVFFYGGTEAMLLRTRSFLKTNYPGVQVAGMFNPPFRNLTKIEDDHVVRLINSSGAAFVFVVLGCPKQERWMASMKGRINAVMVGIGGALPVIIGMQKRAPMWMQQFGLEWLFRLGLEPKRLFKRYAKTNVTFIYLVAKEFLKKYKNKVVVDFNSPTLVAKNSGKI